MGEVVYDGNIDGWFYGFDDNAVFKTMDGTYWRQAEFRYWEHSEFNPRVIIRDIGGKQVMTVAGESQPVERLNDVEETEVDGRFDGWNGKKRYTLTNGETWEEIGYTYQFRLSDDPEAIIVRMGEATLMYVDGIHARVERVE